LDKLEDGSTDIYEKGLLDHYKQRPNSLEDVCLADFSSWYNFKTNQSPGARRPVFGDGKGPFAFVFE
jgi:hypothetical protein